MELHSSCSHIGIRLLDLEVLQLGLIFFFSSEGTDSYVEIKINTGLAVGAKDSW